MSVLYTAMYTAKNSVRSAQQLIGNTAIFPSLVNTRLKCYFARLVILCVILLHYIGMLAFSGGYVDLSNLGKVTLIRWVALRALVGSAFP